MKTRKLMTIAAAAGMLLGSTALQSCEDEDGNGTAWDEFLEGLFSVLTYNGNEYSSNSGDNYFGWFGRDENTAEIEDDINTAALLANNKSGDLPSKVDLRQYLPPIGNQGQYGTCVAWATAYNCRTFLYAKSHNLKTSSLNSSNTFSPADIYMSIGSSDKGSGCGGTYFEAAFDKMVSRGVAPLSTAPYSSINCSGSPSATWSSAASANKIASYREIQLDKNTLKQYLAQGDLVVFGAELGDEFMYTNDATVLTKQTTFTATGQHAYHAMVCAGYDDSKGANGAFLVVNSWGTTWGDNGYIWVDQDFFVSKKFAYCAFIANDGSSSNRVDVNADNEVTNVSDGAIDLIASDDFDFYYSGEDADGKWYECDYNVYNAGSETVKASKDWAICLLYYNAYDANDYDILLVDYYTDDLGEDGEWEPRWNASSAKSYFGFTQDSKIRGFSWNHVDIPGGKSCAKVCSEARNEGTGQCFGWEFTLDESLNGKYYLVLVADAFDCISETDEDNNYLFLGDANDNPITFVNGVPQNLRSDRSYSKSLVCPKQNSANRCQDVRNENNVNAYTSAEIAAMIKAHKDLGMLANVPRSLSKYYAARNVKVRHKTLN